MYLWKTILIVCSINSTFDYYVDLFMSSTTAIISLSKLLIRFFRGGLPLKHTPNLIISTFWLISFLISCSNIWVSIRKSLASFSVCNLYSDISLVINKTNAEKQKKNKPLFFPSTTFSMCYDIAFNYWTCTCLEIILLEFRVLSHSWIFIKKKNNWKLDLESKRQLKTLKKVCFEFGPIRWK